MAFDDETIDVLIGGYMSKDAAQEDYEAVLASRGTWRRGGRRQVQRRAVRGTDRPHGPRGRGRPGRGRVRRRAVCPAAAGRDRGRRRAGKLLHRKTASKLEEQAGATIPVGSAGLIVAYPHSAAAKVEPAVTRALTKAVGEAEGHHVKALKGAIADAQQKMAETGG